MLSDEDFKYKIINASPTRLVIVTYEIVLDRIKKANDCLNNNDDKGFRQNVNNAMRFINELICSIDANSPLFKELSEIYFSVNSFLALALSKKEKELLARSAKIISTLKKEFEKEVDDGINGTGADGSDNYIKRGK